MLLSANSVRWSNLELLASLTMNARNICIRCKGLSLSCSCSCFWFLYRTDRIRLWPQNDGRKRMFLLLFHTSAYPAMHRGKSNTCTTAEPTCCPACSAECRTRWCSLPKRTSRGAAENTGTCSVLFTHRSSIGQFGLVRFICAIDLNTHLIANTLN